MNEVVSDLEIALTITEAIPYFGMWVAHERNAHSNVVWRRNNKRKLRTHVFEFKTFRREAELIREAHFKYKYA